MIENFILTSAHPQTGNFDLDLCRRRYRLYRSESDLEWEKFFDAAERAAMESKWLLERAVADSVLVGVGSRRRSAR